MSKMNERWICCGTDWGKIAAVWEVAMRFTVCPVCGKPRPSPAPEMTADEWMALELLKAFKYVLSDETWESQSEDDQRNALAMLSRARQLVVPAAEAKGMRAAFEEVRRKAERDSLASNTSGSGLFLLAGWARQRRDACGPAEATNRPSHGQELAQVQRERDYLRAKLAEAERQKHADLVRLADEMPFLCSDETVVDTTVRILRKQKATIERLTLELAEARKETAPDPQPAPAPVMTDGRLALEIENAGRVAVGLSPLSSWNGHSDTRAGALASLARARELLPAAEAKRIAELERTSAHNAMLAVEHARERDANAQAARELEKLLSVLEELRISIGAAEPVDAAIIAIRELAELRSLAIDVSIVAAKIGPVLRMRTLLHLDQPAQPSLTCRDCGKAGPIGDHGCTEKPGDAKPAPTMRQFDDVISALKMENQSLHSQALQGRFEAVRAVLAREPSDARCCCVGEECSRCKWIADLHAAAEGADK